MERWFFLRMSNDFLLCLIKGLSNRVQILEEKIAAGLDDKSLTEKQRFMELSEVQYEKEARLDAAIEFLRNYECYTPYVENVTIVLDRLEELRGACKNFDLY